MAQLQTDPVGYFYPNRRGAYRQVYDEALNDSDKTLTVPAGKLWQILGIWLQYASSATAGNRQVRLSIGDGTNTIGITDASDTQAANTTEYYHFIPGTTTPVETISGEHYDPYPGPVMLATGYTLQFDDTADIDGAADDLEARVTIIEYEAT